MILDRNSKSNASKNKSNFSLYVFILCIIGLVFFGARDNIKQRLQKYLEITSASLNKDEIEKIIYEYIKDHPEVIISSLKEMQKRDHEEMLKKMKLTIQNSKEKIEGKDAVITLVGGDKNGDVTIVTFLDYRCGYCKKSNNELKELLKKDSKVKVVFKEYPILGGASQKLSKTAIAVHLVDPSKYIDFHNALMDAKDPNDQFIQNTLKMLNLDYSKVQEAMNDPRVSKELAEVEDLAKQLNVRGTPAFIIGDEFVPGAISANDMMEIIKTTREKAEEKK